MRRSAIVPLPLAHARAAGALWMTCIATGMLSFATEVAVMVPGDAAATANGIAASETMFRVGFAASLVSAASYVGVTALLYLLLKPAGRSLSFVAALFGLAGISIGGVSHVAHYTPLVLLDTGAVSGFTLHQLHAMVATALRLQMQIFTMSLLFFGVQCAIAGLLIVRSSFFPKPLGALLSAGGVTYVAVSLLSLTMPVLQPRLEPLLMVIALTGEGSVTLWLLIKGVDVERWNERNRETNAPSASPAVDALQPAIA